MEAVAKLNNVRIAPRKMQLIVSTIRGRKIGEALSLLKYETKRGVPYIEKLLRSAISNWGNKYPEESIEDADLYVKEIFVTQGKTLKRFRPAPQGRAHRIRKRTDHVTLTVGAKAKAVEIPATENESSIKSE